MWYGFHSPSVWISSLQSSLGLIEKSDTVLGCYRQCKIGHLVLVSRAFQVRLAGVTSEHSQISQAFHSGLRKPISQTEALHAEHQCAHGQNICHSPYSMLLTSRSPRLDFSLALGPGPADTVGAWLHPCRRTPNLSSFCPSWTWPFATSAPFPQLLLGFHSENAPNTKQQKERGGDALAQPSFVIPPVLYWHWDINGELLGERCGCPQGGKGKTSEPLHQWHPLEKQLLLQKSNFWS